VRRPYWILLGLLVLLAAGIVWGVFLYNAIRRQAHRDEARPAPAIVVFGAAEYDGRPSPVFKGRLDHALALEEAGLAPLIIVTGGRGGDPHFTEGGVGRDYLIQQGVAARRIIAETRSHSTYQSVEAVTRILRARGLNGCLAVSDGFHLYRVKLMFAAFGVTAYASPVPHSSIEADPFDRRMYSLREMVLVTLWDLGIRV
jgi:uncharacterized SAM-binding protein YcdF (DUF218 family)